MTTLEFNILGKDTVSKPVKKNSSGMENTSELCISIGDLIP